MFGADTHLRKTKPDSRQKLWPGALGRDSQGRGAYLIRNKAGYTATPFACGWAGAIFRVTRAEEEKVNEGG